LIDESCKGTVVAATLHDLDTFSANLDYGPDSVRGDLVE
jgi:hypothetical protein